jgi:AMP-polyphosphate phosphotransferase
METSLRIDSLQIANDKPYKRLAAFTILLDRLGEGVPLEPRPLDPEVAEAAAHLFDLS